MGASNSQKRTTETENLLALPAGVELGQYRILRTIGQGGFGITYLAEVISTGEQVVIKENLPTFCAMRARTGLDVLPTNPNDDLQEYAQYHKRFVDEAKLLAQLNHPNIVKVLGAFEALGTAYYVMPWVGGKELQMAAPAPGVITESWLLPILRTLLSTLQYLHGNNIYHRDVKPPNILLTAEGSPVLIDFGTARAIISDRSATHVGSPGYSPIEQITARGKRGPWTDVYSLGATCYRLITGERPPEANERLAEEDDSLRPLAPRAELHGRFNPAFLATIDKALALRGKDRWQTTAEWLAKLPIPVPQPVLPASSALDIPTTPIPVISEPAPRSRRNVALILLILVMVLGIPGVYMLYLHAQTVAEQRLLAQLEAEQEAKKRAEREAKEKAEREAKEKAEREAKEKAKRKSDSKIIEIAGKGDTAELSRLIISGADVNAKDRWYRSPLKQAVWEGHTECVRLLLSAPGIDVNVVDDEGHTPLWIAVYMGRTECVRLLLTAPGIDTSDFTPLGLAVMADDRAKLRSLLSESGVDVNATDNNGMTALYWALCMGRTECVRLLLAAPGIDVNMANIDKYGENPLQKAAEKNRTECVRLLLAAPGIDVNKGNNYDVSPLFSAVGEGGTESVRLLLAAPGINVNKGNYRGATPLSYAAFKGHSECVKLLLRVPGIDVNKADCDGETPLGNAERWGRTECARLIREAGGK